MPTKESRTASPGRRAKDKELHDMAKNAAMEAGEAKRLITEHLQACANNYAELSADVKSLLPVKEWHEARLKREAEIAAAWTKVGQFLTKALQDSVAGVLGQLLKVGMLLGGAYFLAKGGVNVMEWAARLAG